MSSPCLMSRVRLNLLTPALRPAIRPRIELPSPSRERARQRLCTLTHYRAGYEYRLDRYEYTETHTTDPHYVVYGVRLMSPSRRHGEALDQISNALKILKPPSTSDVHISREVGIVGIPGRFFATPRHTGSLEPDLSVWAGPPPADPCLSYAYEEAGPPLLVVEIVSHSTREIRDNDWHNKKYTYAHMGIREYWVLDEAEDSPLTGFTLDAPDGTPCALHQYRTLVADADGGLDSQVLSVSLRWHAGKIQCWNQAEETWTVIENIPIVQGMREGELRTWGRILHRLLDAAEPEAADTVLQAWTEKLPAAWPSDETLDKLEEDPGAWRHLLLE